jgi:hypothetical protein
MSGVGGRMASMAAGARHGRVPRVDSCQAALVMLRHLGAESMH